MKNRIGFSLFLICIVMLLVTGCTSNQGPAAATPLPATPLQKDPIIGSWMTIGDSTLYYVFLPDGKFQSGELRSPGIMLLGKWSKTGDNQYLVKIDGASDENFVYVPSGDYIYWTVAPDAHATRYDRPL